MKYIVRHKSDLGGLGGKVMKLALIKNSEQASIRSRNEIIYKTNNEFLDLVGYRHEDIVGKSLTELSVLLKNNFQTCFSKMSDFTDIYIFNNEKLPIDVTITRKALKETNEKIYCFEKNINKALENIIFNFNNIDINSKEGMVAHSYPEFLHLKSNKKYTDMLVQSGFDGQDLVGRRSPFEEYRLNVISKDRSHNKHEVEFIDFNGKTSYWDIYVRLITDDSRGSYVLSYFYDVTERVLGREYLENQRIEMQIILDNIADKVIKIDKEGRYTYVNEAAKKSIDQYKENVISMEAKELNKSFKLSDINGKELSLDEIPEARVLRGEKFNNYIVIGTSEFPTTYHEISGTPLYDKNGDIAGGVLIHRDIEDKLEMEEYYAIKENRKDISISYAALGHDDFKIKYINEHSFKKINKHRPDIESVFQLIGKNFFEFYNNEDEVIIDEIRKAIKEKQPYSHTQKFTTDGHDSYIKTIFKPSFYEDGTIKKVNAIGMDITEEETRNQKMSRALEAQDEVFTNTSHELKTPLNLVFSASQLINMYLKNENLEDARAGIERNNKRITQNCYRLTKLINDILDISKIEEGFYELDLDNRNIVKSIEDIVVSVSDYTSDKEFQIIFNSNIKEKIIAFDLEKIERIMLNLIFNAIKYTDIDGIIMINLIDKGNCVHISVEDNGIGINEEDFDLIFEKFRQVNKSLNRNVEGTGIGLSLVKSIVELHGGKINIESVFGEGSTFTIELPSMTAYEPTTIQVESSHDDRIEKIKFEFSDIYS